MDEVVLILVLLIMSSVFLALGGAVWVFTRPVEGDECKGEDPNAEYEIDDKGKCVFIKCKGGYVYDGKSCVVPKEEEDEEEVFIYDNSENFVYEFIVKEETERQRTHNDFNIHITDIEADGVRVSSEQLEINQEPKHAKCNSKAGKYECEGDNYGINDPEPADDPHMKDLTWSAWKEGQGEVGDKVFTITMPSKVSKFTIDYFRPKYVPGWTIKENGTEVLSTSKGANKDKPTPTVVEYIIP